VAPHDLKGWGTCVGWWVEQVGNELLRLNIRATAKSRATVNEAHSRRSGTPNNPLRRRSPRPQSDIISCIIGLFPLRSSGLPSSNAKARCQGQELVARSRVTCTFSV